MEGIADYIPSLDQGLAVLTNSTEEMCVVDTAPRIKFVPIGFQVNSDSQECPKPSKTITSLARLAVIELVVFLISNLPLMKRIYQRLCGQKVQVRMATLYASMPSLWTLSQRK